MKNAYRGQIRKPEWKRQLVMWEGNIKVDLKEIVGVGIVWINLAEYRFPLEAIVNMVMNISIP
jgi:hypothetical protein